MTAPESHLLQLLLSLILVIPSSYAVGRVHQWYTHSLKRDAAFREGYDHASHSMFDKAMRHRAIAPAETGAAVSAKGEQRLLDAVPRPPALPLSTVGRRQSAETTRGRVFPLAKPGRRGSRRRRLPAHD